MMRWWALVDKELRVTFGAPRSHLVLALFALTSALVCFDHLKIYNQLLFLQTSSTLGGFDLATLPDALNLRHRVFLPLLDNLGIAFIALIPLLTMRVFAEERARGTSTILAMTGVGPWRTLLAKFAVTLLFVGLAAAIAFLYPAAVLARGGPAPELPTSFLGLWLLASSLASIGLAASAASRSQLSAAVLTWALGFALWDLSWLAGVLPGSAPWLAMFSLQEHFVFFADGLVAPGDVVFFLGLILVGLCCGRLALAAVRVTG